MYSAGTFSHLPSEVFVGRSSDDKPAAPCILIFTKLSAKTTSLGTGIPHTYVYIHIYIYKYAHAYAFTYTCVLVSTHMIYE